MAKSTTTMSTKRRSNKPRRYTPPKLNLPAGYNAQSFVRVRDNGQLIVPATFDAGLSWAFHLLDVPDYTEFTTLYDAYVLDRVDITYILENNTPGQFPVLHWAPDYDDATTPLTVANVTTHQNVKTLVFSESVRSHTLSVEPRALQTIYQPGITSGYGWAPQSQIIDMANTNVEFYGIKTWMSHFNAVDTPLTRIRTVLKYHLRFIGQR